MARVYLGLGSNLANPVVQLQAALSRMDALAETRLVRCSQFYSSRPLGPADQPDFVNAVCEIETQMSPELLLSALQGLELELGRVKKRHWGERMIDLDILLYDDLEMSTDVLTIPHLEIRHRDFVLIPLAEIAPGLVIPNLGSVETLIANLTETYLKPL